MIISGNLSRSILRENKFSASLVLSFDNATGQSEFGFSGQNQKYKFSFISGKMYDNDGRYFSSYLPNSYFNIDTDFSGSFYKYFINSDGVAYSGSKSDFYAENFYVNNTGVNIDASIKIASQKPTCVLNTNSTFITGNFISGYLTTSSPSGIKIFSGSFNDGSSFKFNSFPTGYVSASSSGLVLIEQNTPTIGYFISDYVLNTSAGDYSQTLNISGAQKPYLNYFFEIIDGSDSMDSISSTILQSGVSKVGNLILSYGYETNESFLSPSSLPIDISLSYYSGFTGYYGAVTNINIVSGGNGYISPPTVIFSGGGGSLASGIAKLGTTSLDYDAVVSVDMSNYGSGYTSAPTIIFSGGTGVVNNINPTIASGLAETSFYTKSFSGFFDLYTGVNENYLSYSDNSFYSGQSYIKTGSSISSNSFINVRVSYDTSFDQELLVAKLIMSGINGNLIEKYITGAK